MWGYRVLLFWVAFFALAYDAPCFGGGVQRVVVRVEGSLDADLVERIRGQTRDLPFEIVASEASALVLPSARHHLDLADLLAERKQASVVVWRVERSIVIFVPRPTPGRLLIRTVGTARSSDSATPGVMHASSDLETGAVIVRSALLALAAGDEVGEAPSVPRETVAPLPLVVAASRREALSQTAEAPSSLPGAFANLTTIALHDGLGHSASIGGALAAGLRRDWAAVGIVGEIFSSQTVQPLGVPRAGRLSRQAVGALAAVRLLHARRWQVALAGEAGITVLRLTSDPVGTGWEQTQQTGRAYIGTLLEATVRLIDGPTALSLLVGAGLRAVVSPPMLYAQADAVQAMNALSPRILVGLQISTSAGNP